MSVKLSLLHQHYASSEIKRKVLKKGGGRKTYRQLCIFFFFTPNYIVSYILKFNSFEKYIKKLEIHTPNKFKNQKR